MIVDASKLECKRNGLAELLKQAAHVRLDGVQTLNFLVVVHEHITVHLVDEHLVPDVGFDLAGALDDLEELLACGLVVGVVSIDDVDKCATVLYVLHRVRLKHVVTGEVYHIEFNVVVVRDCLGFHVSCRQQKESLVW